MTKSAYTQRRDKIIQLETQDNAIKQSNMEYVRQIQKEAAALTAENIETAAMYGIDLEFLTAMDIEKVAADKEYHAEITAKVEAAAIRACAVLDGLMK